MKSLSCGPCASEGGTLSYPIALADDAGQFVENVAAVLTRPRLRGWIHQYCAIAAVIAGAPLVVVSWAEASKRAGHSTLTYTLAIVAMFAVSAIYHRVNWAPAVVRNWRGRLDHFM